MYVNMQLNEEFCFMEKYEITPTELLFIKILFLVSESDGHEYVQKYFTLPEKVRGSTRELLITLQDKGIITQEFKIPNVGDTFNLQEVTLNKHFIKSFYKHSYELGKELFDVYPLSTVINGVEYKLRRVSKKFDSLEQAFFYYGKQIRWNQDKHNEIINLIKAGKRSGYQFSTLDAFIVDNDWVNLEALNRDGQLSDNMRVL